VTLKFGAHFLDPAAVRVRFRVDLVRERVDVALHHPAFLHMGETEQRDAARAIAVAAFGEDGFERWVGALDASAAAPDPAVLLEDLERAVRSLSENATGERFAVAEGKDARGRPVLVLVNRALKRIDHRGRDLFLSLEVDLERPKPDGFPGPDESRALDAIEAGLLGALRGRAAYLGRVTGAGRRAWHFFADDGAREDVDAFASGRALRVTWTRDPGWDAQRALSAW